ncbi:hypothetical protein [Pedobacter sp. B4-66]|uniref:hypothetical protein n=1 Tax=Pedobacter sp. B4-66 TaxID=2817280 RepID=UPI001BDB31FA|nr:hypothetical protein [Pedobacter sp. B4-66]
MKNLIINTLSIKRNLVFLFLVLLLIGGCEKNDAANSEEDKVLTCGESLSMPFQCISTSGKSTVATTKIPELIGCWDSDDFDFCVKYNSDGTGLITYKPSGLSPGSTQRIKWGAMVKSNGDLLLSNVGTIYIAHESLEGSIDPQIALLSFKQSTKQWYGFDLKSVGKCATVSGGGGGSTGGKGSIIFWTKTDLGCGSISVTINNQSGVINKYFNASPACGTSGAANFSLPAGNYTFTASCSKYKWGPTSVTISEGQCFKMELH